MKENQTACHGVSPFVLFLRTKRKLKQYTTFICGIVITLRREGGGRVI